jgi:hypothetical protein
MHSDMEGRNQKSASGGIQEVEEYFRGGLIPSTPCVSLEVLSNAIPRESVYGTLEMDTHADICVLGPNFIILHYTGRECDVSPYSVEYESAKAVPIVSGATDWTDEGTGLTYIILQKENVEIENNALRAMKIP